MTIHFDYFLLEDPLGLFDSYGPGSPQMAFAELNWPITPAIAARLREEQPRIAVDPKSKSKPDRF